MSEKKYMVIDDRGHYLAKDMSLQTALLLMKAYCEEYYNENISLTLEERVDCASE